MFQSLSGSPSSSSGAARANRRSLSNNAPHHSSSTTSSCAQGTTPTHAASGGTTTTTTRTGPATATPSPSTSPSTPHTPAPHASVQQLVTQVTRSGDERQKHAALYGITLAPSTSTAPSSMLPASIVEREHVFFPTTMGGSSTNTSTIHPLPPLPATLHALPPGSNKNIYANNNNNNNNNRNMLPTNSSNANSSLSNNHNNSNNTLPNFPPTTVGNNSSSSKMLLRRYQQIRNEQQVDAEDDDVNNDGDTLNGTTTSVMMVDNDDDDDDGGFYRCRPTESTGSNQSSSLLRNNNDNKSKSGANNSGGKTSQGQRSKKRDSGISSSSTDSTSGLSYSLTTTRDGGGPGIGTSSRNSSLTTLVLLGNGGGNTPTVRTPKNGATGLGIDEDDSNSLSALLPPTTPPPPPAPKLPQPNPHLLTVVQARAKNGSPFPEGMFLPLIPGQTPRSKGKVLLCLDLDETLVHSSFAPAGKYDARVTLESGTERAFAYVALRPHLRTFIAAIAPLFELAVFTASQSGYADKVMSVVDPDGALGPLRLYREHCALVNGNRVKDLSLLGRPLDRVALLDNSPVTYLFQPRNALPITSWFDDPADSELLRLIPLLRRLAASASVYDVLDVHNALLLDPAYAAAQADADDTPADLPPVRGRRPSPILVDCAKA